MALLYARARDGLRVRHYMQTYHCDMTVGPGDAWASRLGVLNLPCESRRFMIYSWSKAYRTDGLYIHMKAIVKGPKE